MKNCVKRTISISVCLALVLTLFSFGKTYAATALSDSEIFDLKGFGIIEGDESGELHLDKSITRAEFVKTVSKLLRLEAAAYPLTGGIGFYDVSPEHWAYGYISLAVQMGYINGYEDGNFYPEKDVTFNEAVKILTVALGYGDEAQKAGGYPGGYIAMGVTSKLLRNIDVSVTAEITRAAAFKLIYNALDAVRLVTSGYGDAAKITTAESTLREILMGDDREGLVKITGVVTANYDTWLVRPLANITKNQIELDNVLLDKGLTNADAYLGMKVDVYISVSDSQAVPVIKEVIPSTSDAVVELEFEQLASLTDEKISYRKADSTRDTSERLSSQLTVVYNGRAAGKPSTLSVDDMRDGNMRLIIDTDVREVRYIFIDEYESFEVEDINEREERIFIAGDDRFMNLRYIEVGTQRNEVKAYLMDANGDEITLADIRQEDIITVYASLDGLFIKIYACDKAVSGSVNEINSADSKISIDGEEYGYEKKVSDDNVLGEIVLAKLNYLGKIAFLDIDTEASDSFGAIVSMEIGKGIDNNLKALLLIPGRIVDEEEEEDDDSTTNAVPLIAAQNRETAVIEFAQRVTFNGTQYSSAEALVKAIAAAMNTKAYLAVSYKAASDGLVRRLDSLEEYTFLQNTKKYNAYEKTFAGAGGAFGLDDRTMALCIPTNAISSNDDYLARIEMNNNQSYTVNAYNYNKNTHCPDIVVFSADMFYNTSGIAADGKKIGLVDRTSSFLDEEGEVVRKVYMAVPGGMTSFEISDNTASSADFSSLKGGDLILYSLDSKERLDGFSRLEACSPIPGDYKSVRSKLEIFSGIAVDAEYKVVSNNLNRWVDTLKVSGTGLSDTVYELPRSSAPPVYIWDTQTDTASVGTTADFLSQQLHTIVVKDSEAGSGQKLLVRAVVVII